MMKFKNTLIIFLGIIAIIFAGCKEKKATHESGALEEPKVDTKKMGLILQEKVI